MAPDSHFEGFRKLKYGSRLPFRRFQETEVWLLTPILKEIEIQLQTPISKETEVQLRTPISKEAEGLPFEVILSRNQEFPRSLH
ncbi:hypothetical protein C1645_811830 [Glomus cerebriforme]|uniref:Uncharacterized protein n=1 Tax=Glomus cerebriforme TaxID=658196 RepID=A0A397TR54_9GLOM|nr:hypothetical protein C1645_811830 [Glomus cerebriforme]